MDYQPRLLKCGYGTLLGSLVVVALLALPGRAGATDYAVNYGLEAVGSTLTWGPGLGGLNHGASESFTDHIYFSTNNTPFTASFIEGGNNFNNFASLTAKLFYSDGTTLAVAATNNTPYLPFSWVSTVPSAPLGTAPGLSFWDVQLQGVTKSAINLATSGPAAGFAGESGGLVLAAVPEPETYAMMLAGLGLMGFVARRRKQKEVA